MIQLSDGHVPGTTKECSRRALEWYLVGICKSIVACWVGDHVFRRRQKRRVSSCSDQATPRRVLYSDLELEETQDWMPQPHALY